MLVTPDEKPFVALAVVFSVAAPPESVADPRLVPPFENVTVPVAAVAFTVAVSAVVPPNLTVLGLAVSVVMVAFSSGAVLPPPPPQAIMNPASVIPRADTSTVSVRLRRKVNGAPSSTVQKISAPPLFHGIAGEWFAALALGEMVSELVPVPPLVSVTDAGVFTVTFEAVPFDEVTDVVNETVPA